MRDGAARIHWRWLVRRSVGEPAGEVTLGGACVCGGERLIADDEQLLVILVTTRWSAIRGVLDEGHEAGLLARGLEHPNGNR
jgi:hypothetical protein